MCTGGFDSLTLSAEGLIKKKNSIYFIYKQYHVLLIPILSFIFSVIYQISYSVQEFKLKTKVTI